MSQLREHQLDQHNITGTRPRTVLFGCEECNFRTKTENNLEVHRNSVHTMIIKCNLCVFERGTESELLLHEEQIHKKSKFSCTECNIIYQSSKRLQEHRQYKHSEISWYGCDHCGNRFTNINLLDEHIQSNHSTNTKSSSKSRKDVDMRDVQNKKPCNPADRLHNSRCCDRKPRYENKSQSFPSQQFNWNNNGYCSYADSCKFSHWVFI